MNKMDYIKMKDNIERKREELATRKLFEYFEAKKNDGELLDINTLTREEMVQISFSEGHIAAEIARLFNVSKSKVASVKSLLGITNRICIFELMCSVYPEFKEFEFIISEINI